MKKKKKILRAIGCAFLALVLLREVGVLDLNFYQSKLSASQSSTLSQMRPGGRKQFSYHLTMKYGNKTIGRQTHTYNNLPPIEMEATLEEPVYSGNDVLPLAKHFDMTYRFKLTTAKPPQEHTVAGEINGKVTATIYGFCSRRKARELAFKEAKEQITSYLQSQLNH